MHLMLRTLLLVLGVHAASTKVQRQSPDSSCKRLIFNNDNDTVVVDFTSPVIIDSVVLLKKKGEDDSAAVATLDNYILSPANYLDTVQDLKMEDDPASKSYAKLYKESLVDKITMELPTDSFDDKSVYLLNIRPWNNDSEIFTEEFVYEDGKFVHKSMESSRHRWYASSWPWIAIGFIILFALALMKIIFC